MEKIKSPEEFLKEYSDIERQYGNIEITFDGLTKMLQAYHSQFSSPQEVTDITDEEIEAEAKRRYQTTSLSNQIHRENMEADRQIFTDGANYLRSKLTNK